MDGRRHVVVIDVVGGWRILMIRYDGVVELRFLGGCDLSFLQEPESWMQGYHCLAMLLTVLRLQVRKIWNRLGFKKLDL